MLSEESKSEILIKLRLVTGEQPFDSPDEMTAALAELDHIAKREELPAKLRHFLEHRSYMKAMAFLESE